MSDETRLRRLFARRDRLASDLRAVDAQIAAAGREYSRSQGLLIAPRVERIRAAVGA